MSEGIITDQAMKEMADQLKAKYDEITESNRKLALQSEYLKKDLITLYSILRILDTMTNEELDIDPSFLSLIEIGRGIASSMLDMHIFETPM